MIMIMWRNDVMKVNARQLRVNEVGLHHTSDFVHRTFFNHSAFTR